MVFLLIVIVFMVLISIGMQAKKQEKANLSLEEERRKKELEIDQIFDAGKYLTGHSQITTSNVKVYVYSKNDILYIAENSVNIKELGSIPLKEITNVTLEDASTIEKRVTATRLLTLGVFAFAAQKNEKHKLFYLVISWKEGKFDQDTIFEFEEPQVVPKNQPTALQNANVLKSEIMKLSNAL